MHIGNKKVTEMLGKTQQMCYLCIVRKDKEIFVNMKNSEFVKRLKAAGCSIVRHGGSHDIWESPITGNQKPVSRHGSKEMPTGTLKTLEKELLGL